MKIKEDISNLHYKGKSSSAMISVLCDEDRELLLRIEKKIDELQKLYNDFLAYHLKKMGVDAERIKENLMYAFPTHYDNSQITAYQKGLEQLVQTIAEEIRGKV